MVRGTNYNIRVGLFRGEQAVLEQCFPELSPEGTFHSVLEMRNGLERKHNTCTRIYN